MDPPRVSNTSSPLSRPRVNVVPAVPTWQLGAPLPPDRAAGIRTDRPAARAGGQARRRRPGRRGVAARRPAHGRRRADRRGGRRQPRDGGRGPAWAKRAGLWPYREALSGFRANAERKGGGE